MSSSATQQVLIKSVPLKHELVRRSWICCTKYKDRYNFQSVLERLDLNDTQKQIIQVRYLNILENFQRRCRNYSYLFYVGHFTVTVGSLFVPALLSIQNSDTSFTFTGANFSVQVYWSTFVISILVTIFNGILTLFKVDKKYYFLNTTLERLRSEGWQYFSLTGRYSGHLVKSGPPSHANQFVFFTHYTEKIKMKQVEEEYYKADEKAAQTPNGNHINNQTIIGNQDLYPPSPDQPLSSMSTNVPDPVEAAVKSLIRSQSIIHTKNNNEIMIGNIPLSISPSSKTLIDKTPSDMTPTPLVAPLAPTLVTPLVTPLIPPTELTIEAVKSEEVVKSEEAV
jgi:hypothetical protein